MNERMTELYAKACLDARDIHPTDIPAFIFCMAEKFAELIVQECAELVEYNSKGAGRDIREHFGVNNG